MDKKQLYESIMKSIAKQVKKSLSEAYKYGKHEFSHKDLQELQNYILEDDDFYESFCSHGNFDEYDSYEQSVVDFISFLENDLYDSQQFPDSEVHQWYILDEPDLATSWMELKSGKIANIDHIWSEYRSFVQG